MADASQASLLPGGGGVVPAASLESGFVRRRSRKRATLSAGAAAVERALVGMQDGEDISVLTDGSMSMVDFLRCLLDATGPSHVAIATWTMGMYDLEDCERFVSDRRILGMRMLVDPSMFGRRPELSSRLVRGFGVESFRAVNIHAKFCVLSGGRFPVVVRSSMNLNPNRRIEFADVTACPDLADFFLRFVDLVFDAIQVGNRSQSESLFDRLFDGGVQTSADPGPSKFRSLRSAVRLFGG